MTQAHDGAVSPQKGVGVSTFHSHSVRAPPAAPSASHAGVPIPPIAPSAFWCLAVTDCPCTEDVCIACCHHPPFPRVPATHCPHHLFVSSGGATEPYPAKDNGNFAPKVHVSHTLRHVPPPASSVACNAGCRFAYAWGLERGEEAQPNADVQWHRGTHPRSPMR